MAKTVFSIVLLLALVGLAAACVPYYPPANSPTPQQDEPGQTTYPSVPPSQQNPPQNSPPPQTQTTQTPTPKQQSGPPLDIAIDSIGILSAYNRHVLSPHQAMVKFVVVVSDGRTVVERTVPFTGYQPMKNFDTWEVNIKGLHIDSATDHLKLSIRAFDVDPDIDFEKSFLSALDKLGQAGASDIKAILDSLPGQWYLGEYENTWYPSQDWGIGSYASEKGTNLRVCFRIWSNQEPAPLPKLQLQPDVKIERVALPNTVSLGYIGLKNVNHTLVLANNESTDVTIDYFGDSDLAKELYRRPVKGTVKVAGGGSIEVPHQFQYSKAGTNTVTYIIKYNGKELDRWSGTVTVTP